MPGTLEISNNPNCSICEKYVRSGILCDICNRWSHTKCNNLTPTDFNSLKILKKHGFVPPVLCQYFHSILNQTII